MTATAYACDSATLRSQCPARQLPRANSVICRIKSRKHSFTHEKGPEGFLPKMTPLHCLWERERLVGMLRGRVEIRMHQPGTLRLRPRTATFIMNTRQTADKTRKKMNGCIRCCPSLWGQNLAVSPLLHRRRSPQRILDPPRRAKKSLRGQSLEKALISMELPKILLQTAACT